MVIADGAPRLWKAAHQTRPGLLGQRCLVHALRNLLAKAPQKAWEEVKAARWAVWDRAADPGDGAEGLLAFCETCRDRFRPWSAWCVAGQEDRFLEHLHFPREHHRRIRSTNALERYLREVRRRTEVTGSRFPGESSCLLVSFLLRLYTPRLWLDFRTESLILLEFLLELRWRSCLNVWRLTTCNS